MIQKNYNLLEGVVYGASTAIGFGLALVILAGIREQLELVDVPQGMKGVPLSLVIAGILALAFMGFGNSINNIPTFVISYLVSWCNMTLEDYFNILGLTADSSLNDVKKHTGKRLVCSILI